MKKLCALLVCVLLSISWAFAQENAAPVLEIHQMVLGYADGYYIRCGDVEIMIDGGNPTPGSRNDDVMNNLRDLGADTLDMHIITHWHADHCEKLNEVLAVYGDDNTVVYSPSTVPHAEYDPLANGRYQQMVMGDEIEIGGMTITCIGPRKLSQNGHCNSDSLNFVLQYGQRRILFTGDYAQSGPILKEFAELCADVDVFKFPHHGGQPYEIGDFAARAVSPSYVLMPSRINGYKVSQFFRDRGAGISQEHVFSNVNGHVVVLTDGGAYLEVLGDQNPADYAPKGN